MYKFSLIVIGIEWFFYKIIVKLLYLKLRWNYLKCFFFRNVPNKYVYFCSPSWFWSGQWLPWNGLSCNFLNLQASICNYPKHTLVRQDMHINYCTFFQFIILPFGCVFKGPTVYVAPATAHPWSYLFLRRHSPWHIFPFFFFPISSTTKAHYI